LLLQTFDFVFEKSDLDRFFNLSGLSEIDPANFRQENSLTIQFKTLREGKTVPVTSFLKRGNFLERLLFVKRIFA
jgi:hypothetical protein